MVYILGLEAYDDDRRAIGRYGCRRPWVAELSGPPLRREFLRGRKDYSRANGRGSSGVYYYYDLVPGRVYEVYDTITRRRHDRFYCRTEGGRLIRVTEGRAMQLVSQQGAPPPEGTRAPLAGDVARGRKRGLGMDVLTAARQRIARVFDDFPRVCVSFSGGKDSSVMLHLAMEEARRRGRRVGVLFIDLEAQYRATVAHVEEMFSEYAGHADPYWVALPLALRNAVSMYDPRWMCWDPEQRERWVRTPPHLAITDEGRFPFFRRGMEFEEFVERFGQWYSQGEATACLVGIRSDESLNRYRAIAGDATRHAGLRWTTWKSGTVYNAYPIYDWRTSDIWAYNARSGKSYNRLYDLMHQAGLSIHQQRICQPYGDDQRKGLWLYHVIEPETWGRVVARVNGANSGALYSQESGNVLGRIKVSKPDGHTWQSFAHLLMESLPPNSRDHFRDKIAVFLRWYQERGYPGGIPDEADPKMEAAKKAPSWRRICKALLRNDYWCKGLSFTQTKSDAYAKYRDVMRKRRAKWGMTW